MKNKIAINICTPTKDENWGDNSFANNLKKSLEKFDYSCDIFCKSEWGLAKNYPITITITGKYKYNPNPNSKNIIWNISHPEIRTKEELNSYDLVLIASEYFANLIKPDLKVPIYFFPQATNEKQFYPLDINKEFDILFVGNNYYDNLKYRVIIGDLLKTKYKDRFFVVGKNWGKTIRKNQIISDYIEYNELNNLYSRAKIVLNDHHGMMKKYGFINNRTYDLCAAKVFQISDYVPGMEKLGIVYYDSPQNLENLINQYLNNNFERSRNIKITNYLTKDYRFSIRAEQLDKFIKSI